MISTMRHSKLGNVDSKLGFVMLVGTMVGIECGAQIVMYLERLGMVGSVVRWVLKDYPELRQDEKPGQRAGAH